MSDDMRIPIQGDSELELLWVAIEVLEARVKVLEDQWEHSAVESNFADTNQRLEWLEERPPEP